MIVAPTWTGDHTTTVSSMPITFGGADRHWLRGQPRRDALRGRGRQYASEARYDAAGCGALMGACRPTGRLAGLAPACRRTADAWRLPVAPSGGGMAEEPLCRIVGRHGAGGRAGVQVRGLIPVAGLAASQHPRDGGTDAFRRRLGLPVADVGVAKRHAWALMAEQTRDDRQRNASQDGVACERLPEVVQADVFRCGGSMRGHGLWV